MKTNSSLLNNKNLNKSLSLESDFINKIKVKKPSIYKMDNGMYISIFENNKFPLITVNLDIDIPPIKWGKKTGLKNIFGEMIRSGTKKYNKIDLDENIEKIGTEIYTHYSGIYMVSLKKYFNKSIELMSEILLNPTFNNTDEFNRLIKQRIMDIEISKKDPNIILNRVKKILNFGANNPNGEYENLYTLKNIKIKDLKCFYKKYFKPNISYLSFIGDINKDEIMDIYYKFFSTWKKNNISNGIIYPNKFIKSTEIFLVDLPSANQSSVVIGHPINLKKKDSFYFPSILSNGIFGGGIQSRLCQKLREENGVTYAAYSVLECNKYQSSFFTYFQVKKQFTFNSIQEFLIQNKNISNEYVDNEELNNKKKEMIGQFIIKLENKNIVSNFIVNEIKESLPKDFYKKYIYNIKNVTHNEIMESSKKYMSFNNSRIIIVGNAKNLSKELKNLKFPIFICDDYGNNISI